MAISDVDRQRDLYQKMCAERQFQYYGVYHSDTIKGNRLAADALSLHRLKDDGFSRDMGNR